MSETVTVDGEEYELDDNPSLKTVREVQSMQMGILTKYISEEKLKDMDSLEDEGEIISAIVDEGGYDAFQNVMFDRSMLEPVQTISLACDNAFEPENLEEMGAQDFKDMRKKAEDALNGDVNDFFNGLGIGMSLMEEEAQNRQP